MSSVTTKVAGNVAAVNLARQQWQENPLAEIYSHEQIITNMHQRKRHPLTATWWTWCWHRQAAPSVAQSPQKRCGTKKGSYHALITHCPPLCQSAGSWNVCQKLEPT